MTACLLRPSMDAASGGVTTRSPKVLMAPAGARSSVPRNKIGVDAAVEALRDYRRLRKGTVNEMWRHADQLRMRRVMRPYWDAIAG